jgi:hypothetical protein
LRLVTIRTLSLCVGEIRPPPPCNSKSSAFSISSGKPRLGRAVRRRDAVDLDLRERGAERRPPPLTVRDA